MLSNFLNSIPWYAWIAIVKSVHRHEERMEMIKQGMGPSKSKQKDE